MKLKGCFLSNNQNWRTPKKLYEELNKEFNFNFDPCPVNPTFDGLNIEWGKCNFVNPPYNRETYKWCKKAYEEHLKGKTVVMLLASRTDTKFFHEFILKANEIRFIKGRLKFNDKKGSAPFPSLIAVFKNP